MSIFDRVLEAHRTILALEEAKKAQMQTVGAVRSTTIGGIVIPLDPEIIARAVNEVQQKYNDLIETKRNQIQTALNTAETDAKRAYYNALPFGSDYQGEINRIKADYEADSLFPQNKVADFMSAVREHVELSDKWALIYVLAGLDLFPDNAELYEHLEKVAPEVAAANEEIGKVKTAKALAEVFDITYYTGPGADNTIDRIHAKRRLAELGANPNFDADYNAVYAEFCKRLGVDCPQPSVTNIASAVD